ncbi:MAG TPA: response regulator, partial [Candidatus Limnocylindria bacterium]|nr:response regulator [Candidatus Limnocylindria bacterium]
MIRVLLADDDLAVRDGVRALLAGEREINVVGEAANGLATLSLTRSLRPDLLVLDNAMPGLSGLDVARKIRDELPETGVVFLSMDPGIRDLALAAGATAFVPKDAPSDELLRAVRAAAAALTNSRHLADLRPEWARVVELLLGTRIVGEAQLQEALAQRATHESPATALLRLGVVNQPDLADVLARASGTPLVSLAPYPEIVAPIDPTESRLSSPRLVDPVEREAACILPFDLGRSLGVVITVSDGRQGVVAMADPLDDVAFREAERHSKLRLTRVTATSEEIQDTLARVRSSAAGHVVWTGDLVSRVYTSAVLGIVALAALGCFGFFVREALAPRFAFSLFALLCGLFFFLYAL